MTAGPESAGPESAGPESAGPESAGLAATAVRIEPAHAKINLLLRILAREASGYHGIETLFQQLALHDIVRVTVGSTSRTLDCRGPSMPSWGLGPPEKNLAWQAAEAYAAASGWDTGWHIAVEKHIPVGGGLGGGSADAAAVLRALESMSPSPLGVPRLLELAGSLGADVPFFVSGASRAWAWGRGDRLLPLAALPPMGISLVTFGSGVNTAAAYGAFAAARAARNEPVLARGYPLHAFDSWPTIAALAVNDFERIVPDMHPGVRLVLPRVREVAAGLHASGVPAIGMMSGSGATCFVMHPLATRVSLDAGPSARVVLTSTR